MTFAASSPAQKTLYNIKLGQHFTLRKGNNNATTLAKIINPDWVSRDYKNNRNCVTNRAADGHFHGYGFKTTTLPPTGTYVRTTEERIWVEDCQKFHLQVVNIDNGKSYWLSEYSFAHPIEYGEVNHSQPAHYPVSI